MSTTFEDIEKSSAKKLTGIGVVIFLHILVGLVLMAGMAKDIIKPSEEPVELMIIQDMLCLCQRMGQLLPLGHLGMMIMGFVRVM